MEEREGEIWMYITSQKFEMFLKEASYAYRCVYLFNIVK